MPPTLRSSAPTTPERSISSSTSPGRKTPCCAVCHRPRKGHPRQGCPYEDEVDGGGTQATPTAQLSRSMGSMSISSASVAKDNLKATRTKPDTKYEARRTQGRLMPGTLYPPLESFLQESPSPTPPRTCSPSLPSSQKTEIIEHDEAASDSSQRTEIAVDLHANRGIVQHSTQLPSHSMVRSASIEARQDFLDDISKLSTRFPVSVYTVSVDDVLLLTRAARKLGFHAASVVARDESATPTEALLIIGISEKAVQDIQSQISSESRSKTSGLAMNVLAVAAGAALTFAGLASLP